MALAARGSVNSTYCPGASCTAERPEASAASVYGVVLGLRTTPLVWALSASCSTKPTDAPRPATNAGSMAARVTAGVRADGDEAAPPTPVDTLRPRATTVATTNPVRDITGSFLS